MFDAINIFAALIPFFVIAHHETSQQVQLLGTHPITANSKSSNILKLAVITNFLVRISIIALYSQATAGFMMTSSLTLRLVRVPLCSEKVSSCMLTHSWCSKKVRKINNQLNVEIFACNNYLKDLSLQNCTISKWLMPNEPCILRKMLSIQTQLTEKGF